LTKRLGVADAKARFSELLREVAEGKHIVVERRGRPIATIRPYEAEDEAPPTSWLDSLWGIAEDIPDFEEIMDEVVESRRDTPTRKVDFDS